MRVGERIHNARIAFERKHPIILPSKGNGVTTIIRDAHVRALHGGKQITINSLRLNYWILNGSRTVKTVLHKCIQCHKNKPNLQKQLMGHLPTPRVNFTKTFLHTGVDFAGPIQIKSKTGRGVRSYKSYIAVFLCMATKAIHIELVGSLSSESFIAALKRFVARRGTVECLYSDNGTNFVGAFRKLKNLNELLRHQQLEWKFNPPSAPHFGGLWEAGVKSVKFHLKGILGNSIVTVEEMTTILTQVESCLNARPLCPLSDDIDDLDALTPNHFLTGQIMIPIVEENLTDVKEALLKRWQFCTQKYQEVCRRYKNEYLHRLQQRPKWLHSYENVKVGQLFLIKDDNRNINHWPLGRVLEVHPGTDGLIRVVTLKTLSGILKRPIHKLSPLPIETAYDNNEEEPIQTKNSAVPVRRSRRLQNQPPLIISILIGLFALALVSAQSIQYFKHQPGVHFKEEGSVNFISNFWMIGVTQNLTEFRNSVLKINDSINTIEIICQNITFNCDSHLDSLKWQYQMINGKVKLIQNRRSKRAAPLIAAGIAAGSGIAVGVIGTAFFLQGTINSLEKEIQELEKRQNNLLISMKKHTEWMEGATTLIDKFDNETTHLNTEINQAFDAENTSLFELNLKQQMYDVFLICELIINKLESLQNLIFDIRMHRIPHKSIVAVLNLSFFDEYYLNISTQLPPDLKLPEYQMAEELLFYPTFTIEQNTIEFQFSIPIIFRYVYTKLKLIPIPILHHGKMIWVEPSSNYIALTGHKAKIIPFENECKRISQTLICQSSNPNPDDDEKLDCELSMLLNNTIHASCLIHATKIADVWTAIDQETWAFTLAHPVAIRIGNSTKHISGSGILSYRNDTIIEYFNKTIFISDNMLYTPTVNLTSHLSDKNVWMVQSFKTGFHRDVMYLEEKMADVRASDSLSPIKATKAALTFGPYIILLIGFTIIFRKLNNLKREPIIDNSKYFSDVIQI